MRSLLVVHAGEVGGGGLPDDLAAVLSSGRQEPGEDLVEEVGTVQAV